MCPLKRGKITSQLDQESVLFKGIDAKSFSISVFGLPLKEMNKKEKEKAEIKIKRILENYLGG